MKRYKLSFLALALALFTFVGCDEPNSEKLFELSFVELDAATTSNGSRVYSYLRENNGINKPSGFKVNLASKPLSEAVTVNFEILTSSTAIPNVHYVANGTSVTIPAGENVVEMPIDIISDGINAGEQLSINIRITDATVDVMDGLDEASHLIQITCDSDLEGTYDLVSTATNGSPGFWTGAGTATLTRVNSTTYTLDDFANGAFGAPQAMQIQDICGTISEGEPATGLADIASGSVDAGTGAITIDFVLTCCGGNNGDTWQYILTPQ